MDVLASVLEQCDPDEYEHYDVQPGQVALSHILVDDLGDHPRQRDHCAGVHRDGCEDEQQPCPVWEQVREESPDYSVVVDPPVLVLFTVRTETSPHPAAAHPPTAAEASSHHQTPPPGA